MASLNYLKKADSEEDGAANAIRNILKGYDRTFKVIIIGDQFTGKTALLMRIGEGEGKALKTYDATIGVDCRTKTFQHGDSKVRL